MSGIVDLDGFEFEIFIPCTQLPL